MKKLWDLWNRHWVTALIILTFMLGVVSTINLSRDIGRPFGGFIAYYNIFGNQWKVHKGTPPWWPGLAQTQLVHESVVVALGDEPYGDNQAELYADAYARHQSSVPLTVRYENTETLIQIPIVPFTVAQFLDIRVPNLIIALGFWLLAIVVYRTQPTVPLNRLFAVGCCIMAINRSLTYYSLFRVESTLFLKALDLMVDTLFSPFMGGLFFHFALSFPTPIYKHRRAALFINYSLTLLVVGIYTISRLLFWLQGYNLLIGTLDKFSFYALRYMYIGGLLAIMARFVWMLRTSRNSPRKRQQALLLLIGFVVAWRYIWSMTIVNDMLGKTTNLFWNHIDLLYLTLAIPTVFALVILRYQTLRGAPPLFLGVVMLMLSAMLANITQAVAYWLNPHWLNANSFPIFLPMMALIMMASLFWGTQSTWQGFFGRLLHWKHHSYDAVRRFGQRVVGQRDLEKLPGVIAVALTEELELEQAAVWLWQEEEGAFHLVGQEGAWSEALPLPALLTHPADMQPFQGKVIRLNDPAASLPRWLAPLKHAKPAELIVPLIVSGNPVGLLVLGKRWDEEIFDERDLEIVELIAQQAALFLLTALQVNKLRQVPHHVAQAQERERVEIAQELHDTIQQFLGRLPFFLEMGRGAAWTDPSQSDQILRRCIAEVTNAAKTVRQIQSNLAPMQLNKGFIQPLTHFVESFSHRTELPVYLEMAPNLERHILLEARHSLYRVVQEALRNVDKHANATEVKITMARTDERVTFTIQDNGGGFSEQQRQHAQAQGSFGLQSMISRIHSLGGELIVHSIPGEGTTITGWLPCDEKIVKNCFQQSYADHL